MSAASAGAGDLSEQARALVAEGDFPHHPKVIRAVGMLLRMADSLDEARRLYVDLVEAKEVVPLSLWDEMRNQRNEARDALAAKAAEGVSDRGDN